MSATLIARSLAAGHGERALFSGLDLVVAPGDIVGLVGANGAGKSTLLAILAGLQRPEEGTVELSPRAANVGHLPQEPERRAGESVREFLGRRTGVGPAQLAMEAGRERARRRARPARRPRTAMRSSAGSPSAAPTSTSAPTPR